MDTMSMKSVLFAPDESERPGSPPLIPFRPRHGFDSTFDSNCGDGLAKFNTEGPRQAARTVVVGLFPDIEATEGLDDIEEDPSDDEVSESGADGYESDTWTRASDPSSPDGSNIFQRPKETRSSGRMQLANEARAMDLQELASKAVTHALARTDPTRRSVDAGQEPSNQEHHQPLASILRETLSREPPLHRDAPIAPAAPPRGITLPPQEYYQPTDRFSPRQLHNPVVGSAPCPLTSPRTFDGRSPTHNRQESELPPLHSPNGVSWLPPVKELMISTPPPGTPGRDGRNQLHSPPPFSHSLPNPGPTPVPPLRPASISGPHVVSPISPDGPHPRDLASPVLPPPTISSSGFFLSSKTSSDPTTSLPRLTDDHGSTTTEGSRGQAGVPSSETGANAPDAAPAENGTFKCNFEGCLAKPFQTQYLLNSHANVHSLERPHYCSVPGCRRSKAGQGFKRKNEMIRHGFVHKSPGYACPFCPDREHKYPRPDNLQRHVRSRHMEVDKNDPRLLEVLAQRPDGPSRGRRRRTAPS